MSNPIKITLAIVLTAVVTAGLVGGGLYLLQPAETTTEPGLPMETTEEKVTLDTCYDPFITMDWEAKHDAFDVLLDEYYSEDYDPGVYCTLTDGTQLLSASSESGQKILWLDAENQILEETDSSCRTGISQFTFMTEGRIIVECLSGDAANRYSGEAYKLYLNGFTMEELGLPCEAETEEEDAVEEVPSECDIENDLPTVSWERAGLLSEIDRNAIQEKVIDPYLDYYNEEEIEVIAMIITVPENVGEEFAATAIYRNGGMNAFLFGAREGAIDWWYPECMDACDFSDAFSDAYPEVVSAANGI